MKLFYNGRRHSNHLRTRGGKTMRKLRIATIIFLSLLLAGCLNIGKKNHNTSSGNGTRVTGRVVFADTPLTLASVVRIGDQRIQTDTGVFNTTIKSGVHDYVIETLLGTYTGTVEHQGNQNRLTLIVPAFPGWDPVDYNNILVNDTENATTRWPVGKNIKVWIEPPNSKNGIKEKHVEMAWRAFLDWQEALDSIITFQKVSSESQADITVRFVPKLRGERGMLIAGECYRSWSRNTKYLQTGKIRINVEHVYGLFIPDEIGIYRHEVGHCIGLGHSTKEHHLMYYSVGEDNNEITPVEKNLARLLYSIQPNTGYIPTHQAAMVTPLSVPTSRIIDYDPETGLVTEVIQSIPVRSSQ